jgi:5-methylcytosine-specific restriction endonuclease McrBC GTP-binding regulatory subunit McrB
LTRDDRRRWRLVQFHPSYGYESFIEGLQPTTEDGAVRFEVVIGTVLRMAEAAKINPDKQHVLIMDEMNRANVPRVLGELMFLFEYRDQLIDLQYSQGFALPQNVLFIATMNTADRSIRSIDTALRRRFEVFECLPDVDLLKRFYDGGTAQNQVPELADGFIALNEQLRSELDRHHTIGQTFFMANNMTPERLRRVWTRKIYPLIEEYFFDLPDVAQEFQLARFWPSVSS